MIVNLEKRLLEVIVRHGLAEVEPGVWRDAEGRHAVIYTDMAVEFMTLEEARTVAVGAVVVTRGDGR